YQPAAQTLKKYADVLVNFALGGGFGVKKGEVVYLSVSESAKPLYVELRRAIWRVGAHLIADYRPSNDWRFNLDKDFYLYAGEQQLKFFPQKYLRGLINQIDHKIYISSQTNKQALRGVDPQKIMARMAAFKPYREWSDQKENRGELSWVIALYPTTAMAKEAGLSLEKYWQQVVRACFLDKKDTIGQWRAVYRRLRLYRDKLNKLPISKLHVTGPAVDLWVGLGAKRRWVGCSGRNIPSFELFVSPDWRQTLGWAGFNQPLYAYGHKVTGIELEFKQGRVVRAKAQKNQKVLDALIATKNADKIGEFSLTDKRFSRITRFMAEILYDENMGGPAGNFHLALGAAYHDSYRGKPASLRKRDWQKLGFNDSAVHADLISTTPRTVTACLKNGRQRVIYHNGEFVI
ncbi:MAG: aminopeptidase, partial [Candidatus Portnoybacteria bacterium CG10_big_fil_rev_8_21_14_0_10_44_7]